MDKRTLGRVEEVFPGQDEEEGVVEGEYKFTHPNTQLCQLNGADDPTKVT